MARRDDLLNALQKELRARAAIAARAPLAARQERLARALDALNAFDALDGLRRLRWPAGGAFGPRPFVGAAPVPWVGVLLWRRAAGYYGYKTLTLMGAWAVEAAAVPLAAPVAPLPAESNPDDSASEPPPIALIAGTRTIPYTSDFYVAEAYFKLIRETFTDYYSDDGRPSDVPPAFIVDPKARLAQRAALLAALSALA